MIHYSCDLCKRLIDAQEDIRYVVKIEVYAALDSSTEIVDDDRDGLQDLQDSLQRLDDGDDDQVQDEVYQQLRFDLCPQCRKRFLKQPLGRESLKQFNFSQN